MDFYRRGKDIEKKQYICYVINVGDRVMTTTKDDEMKKEEPRPIYSHTEQISELHEPMETYLQAETDLMTEDELEEELSKIPFQRIPGLAYTHEERIAELNEAMERHLRGESDMMDHDDFMKEMEKW